MCGFAINFRGKVDSAVMAALKLRIYLAPVLEAPFPKLSHLMGSLSQMILEMSSLDRPVGCCGSARRGF